MSASLVAADCTGGDGGDVSDGVAGRDAAVSDDATDEVKGEPWKGLLGGSGNEYAWDLVRDSSANTYVTGSVDAELAGESYNGGDRDAFLAKFGPSGQEKWVKLIGTDDKDVGQGVALGASGAVYVAGMASGAMGKASFGGTNDGFVAKYSASGERKWVNLFGSKQGERFEDVATASNGGIYAVGYGRLEEVDGVPSSGMVDAFVVKYDSSGDRGWVEPIGTPKSDRAFGVDAAGDAAYVVGDTDGDLGDGTAQGDGDAFVARFTSGGSREWVRVPASSENDVASAVAVHSSGDILIGGVTRGSLGGEANAGSADGLVAKYDSSGQRQWLRLVGTPGSEEIGDVMSEADGSWRVAGNTDGEIDGTSFLGGLDGFVVGYDAGGNRTSAEVFGTEGDDYLKGIARTPGGLYAVTGYTRKSFGGDSFNGGNWDTFVQAYSE